MFYLALVTFELFIWSLTRVLFYFWNFSALKEFGISDIIGPFLLGLRVDLVTLGLLAAPSCLVWLLLSLASRFTKVSEFRPRFDSVATKVVIFLFLIPVLIALILTLGDVEFTNFMGRRLSSQSGAIFQESQGKWGALIAHDWLLFSIGFVICAFNL